MLCILSIGHFNKPHALVHFLMISLEIILSMVWDYNFTIRKTIFFEETYDFYVCLCNDYLKHFSKADPCDSPLLERLHPEGSA